MASNARRIAAQKTTFLDIRTTMNTITFFSPIGQTLANGWKRAMLTIILGTLLCCGSASAQAPGASIAPGGYGGVIHTITEVWNNTPYPTDLMWYFTDANRRAGYYDPQDLAHYNALRKNLKDSGATFNYSKTETRPGISFRSVKPQQESQAPPTQRSFDSSSGAL